MREIFFFIGTEAELIKVFPVILECKRRGLKYHIIASGQNDITNSDIIKRTQCGYVELELSQEMHVKKNALGLLTWWFHTYTSAENKIKDTYQDTDWNNSFMIVHGDTVSTYMGARIGRSLGMVVCHIEAGLRSHNLLNPFPEEIDRLLTSRIARIHFAPGEEAEKNLKKAKGKIVNTGQNTLRDSLMISDRMEECEGIYDIISRNKPYFVFVMHRQENLANSKMVKEVVARVLSVSRQYKCVVILHTITQKTLEKLGLMDILCDNSGIIMLPRVDYFSFMKLLRNSEFVITDGGSNQEELSYMGKPTLILRKMTERNEGIGKNAEMFSGACDIDRFSREYKDFMYEAAPEGEASKTIADYLENYV